MKRLFGRLLRLALLAGVLAVIAVVWLIHTPARYLPTLPAIDDRVYLDQGWGREVDAPGRQAYYYTPTGSSLHDLRYDWLLHLEMPWGKARFAEPTHLRSYGFLVDPQPTAGKPARLPVGFARRFDPAIGEAVLDISCAACHTGELVVNRAGRRTAVRIDGGPAGHALATARLGRFLPTLTAALASTYLNPLKFRRFGKRVLGNEGYARGKWPLHADLGKVLVALVRDAWNERYNHPYPVDEGLGRSDGAARLVNERLAEGLRRSDRVRGGAPIRYPSLWNLWKLDHARSASGVEQPMARSMIEAYRAGARVVLLDRYGQPLPPEERFRSSISIAALYRIESTLQQLEPPRWPEDVFGPVDRAKADRGRRLFVQHCERCHGVVEAAPAVRAFEVPLRPPGDPFWEAVAVPLSEIGTDPKAAVAASSRTVDLRRTGLGAEDVRAAFRPMLEEYRGRLERLRDQAAELRKANDFSAPAVETALSRRRERLAAFTRSLNELDVGRLPVAMALDLVVRLSRRKHDEERGILPQESECLDGFGALALPQAEPAYEARPLAGVWARGPFLHNGSVPTLYQLLSPQDERDTRFFVQPGAFDPKPVGVDRSATGDGFWHDTRLEGNSNVGHEFRSGYAGPAGGPQYGVIGPALSPEERWAIVEYLKVHQDPPTPSGRLPPECRAR